MTPPRFPCLFALVLLALGLISAVEGADEADLILIHGKVVTVDRGFSIRQAIAVKGDRLLRVGTDAEILQTRGAATKTVDLGGKMVLPGLIDSHTHPTWASMTEFDHPVPQMDTIGDVLAYVEGRASILEPGQWVVVSRVFITRLAERRYPTRDELDRAAPQNPVLFSTGPDASLNSDGPEAQRDRPRLPARGARQGRGRSPATGEPTGILRNLTRYVKLEDPAGRRPVVGGRPTSAGWSSCSATTTRSGSPPIDRPRAPSPRTSTATPGSWTRVRLLDGPPGDLAARRDPGPARADPGRDPEGRRTTPSARGGPRLRIVGIKTFLDGGMLTGSAYMREPWGVSRIYSIDDPTYRGVLFIPRDRLVPMVRAAVESGLQFTAHSVGDGAVHALLDAYDEVNRTTPVAPTRPCLTHSNFMSAEAIATAARLGVVADFQPAWLYLDTGTLSAHFGNDRLRYFQPLQSLFRAGVVIGGGSDHMQKIGSLRSINFYNPFLAIWVAITRQAKGFEGKLHPEEALTREQAIRFYTINNAHLLFLEDRVGSLEAGKQADFVVIDRDLLSCPEPEIREARALATYLDGRPVFERRD